MDAPEPPKKQGHPGQGQARPRAPLHACLPVHLTTPLRSVVLGLTHFTDEQTGTQRGLSLRPRINETEEKRSVGWRGVLLRQACAQRRLVTLECACRGRHMLPRELPHLLGAACQAGHLLWSRAAPSDSHLLLERPAPGGLQPVKQLQETDLPAPPAACSEPCLYEQPCGVFCSPSSWERAGRGGGSVWLSWAPAAGLATGAPGRTLSPASRSVRAAPGTAGGQTRSLPGWPLLCMDPPSELLPPLHGPLPQSWSLLCVDPPLRAGPSSAWTPPSGLVPASSGPGVGRALPRMALLPVLRRSFSACLPVCSLQSRRVLLLTRADGRVEFSAEACLPRGRRWASLSLPRVGVSG